MCFCVLATGQFDSEGAAQGVHLVGTRFPRHRGGRSCGSTGAVGRCSAAVFTVNEQLADLLGDGDVVHNNGQLRCVHWTLI